MANSLYFVEFFLSALILLLWHCYRKKSSTRLPPGPFRYPIFGSLPQIISGSKYPAVALSKLADIYGDVMYIEMGYIKAVVFSSHDAILEMLKHDSAIDRAMVPVIDDRNMHKNLGLIWGNGEKWQETRRFTLRYLRDFGFGKSQTMDVVINNEVDKFVDHLRKLSNQNASKVVPMFRSFDVAFLNVVWRLVDGKSYSYDDPRIAKLLLLQYEFFRSTDLLFHVSDIYPFLRDWFPRWTKKTKQVETSMNLYHYCEEILQEHKEYVRDNPDHRGLLDVYVSKIEELKNSNVDENSPFTDEQCILSFLDLLLGGSETSSNTMLFGVLYMLLHPSIQEKVQAEIDEKIPHDEPINLEMRKTLPYTHSTLLEILRYSSILPVPASRAAKEDFDYRGYFIKKGTVLITNVQASHFNKSTWGDPYNFRPERFLNEDGTGVDFKIKELMDTFGAGKRYCLGQSVAEATLFIFFASVVRKFNFLKVEGEAEPTVDPVVSSIYTPQAFNVRIVERT